MSVSQKTRKPTARIGGSGVLPYAFDEKGRLLVLLGKERKEEGWEDSLKWAEFAGRLNRNESIRDCAVREFYEESSGIIMTEQEIKSRIKDAPFFYSSRSKSGRLHRMYVVEMDYEPDLPVYFQRVRKLLFKFPKNRRDDYMEKVEIRWFQVNDLVNKPKLYNSLRPVFQESFDTWVTSMVESSQISPIVTSIAPSSKLPLKLPLKLSPS